MNTQSTMTDVLLDRSNKRRLSSFEKQHDNEILLLEAPKEDLSILHNIGLDYAINKIKHEKNQLDALTGLKKIYNKPVYLGEDIKKLCNKYDLRLLPVQYFKGKINNEMIEIIKNFQKESNTEISLVGYERFFILAPEEYFFSNKPINSIKNCTLFYREENRGKASENQRFIKVHSWGENYSFFRTLRFVKNDSTYKDQLSYAFSIFLLTLITLFLFILSYIFKNEFIILTCSSVIWISKMIYDLNLIYNKDLNYTKKWNHKYYKLSDYD